MTAEAVLFDFGGTLDSNGITWLDRFYPLYLKQDISVSLEEFVRAFYDADDHLSERFNLTGLGLEETITLQVKSVFNALTPGRKNAAKAAVIVQEFVMESRRYFRQNIPLLRRLYAKYPLGVVSNFYGNVNAILDKEGFHGLFKVVADSGKIGHQKPSSEIFSFALQQMGVDPSKTWMIGDSLGRDMKGAESMKMPHAWLKGDRPNSDSACCQEAVVLSSLTELEPILSKSRRPPIAAGRNS